MRPFSTIAVEIGAQCNRTCWFCPNATNKRPPEFMPMELITKIAKELAAVNYAGRVVLYIYNEPMLDKRLISIIELFRELVPKSTIMLATNGDYIRNGRQTEEMFEAGLNQLQVNVYSGMKRYRVLRTILEDGLGEEGNIYTNTSPKKMIWSLEQKFDKLITPESPKVGRFALSNRSGNVPSLPALKEPLPKPCVRPFRSMQVNWQGKAILCCNDYHADVECGDVNKHNIFDIWENSKILRQFRKKLILKDRVGLKLCDVCSFNGGAYPHFLPKFWPEVLPEREQHRIREMSQIK